MNALESLKDAKINDRAIELQPFYRHTNQRDIETYQKCFIKNFPENYKDEDLETLFSEFEKPISCRVIFEKKMAKASKSDFVGCSHTKKQ